MNLREARLRDAPPPPLTNDQIARRLWELGISEDNVYNHIIDHKHIVPIEAWYCLWMRHLHNPTMGPFEILCIPSEEQ